MTNMGAVAGICIIATVLCKIMDKYQKEYALFLSLIISVGIILLGFSWVSPLFSEIQNMFQMAGADSEYFKILLKSLGICYITQFACDICRDSGENAIATQLELAGKISLLILAMPLFKVLIGIITDFIY